MINETAKMLSELNDNARRFWKNHKWGGCEPEDFPEDVHDLDAVLASLAAHVQSLAERVDRLESLEEEW